MSLRLLGLLALGALAACSIEEVELNQATDARRPGAAATARWDRLLRAHVSDAGDVDYRALARDRADLDAYIASLAAVDLEALGADEQKALWINAYNAITIAGILRFWPTKSIRDHSGFWDRILTHVGGREVSLDDIEHRILRPLGDPRIHTVINCASRSCPKLQNRAWRAETLDADLDAAARAFLADPARNRFDDERQVAELSQIFSWFGHDFEVEPYGGVRGFVRRFVEPRDWLRAEFPIRWKPYDWSLNGPTGEH